MRRGLLRAGEGGWLVCSAVSTFAQCKESARSLTKCKLLSPKDGKGEKNASREVDAPGSFYAYSPRPPFSGDLGLFLLPLLCICSLSVTT